MSVDIDNDVNIYLVSVYSISDTAFVIKVFGRSSCEFMIMQPRQNWSSGFFSHSTTK